MNVRDETRHDTLERFYVYRDASHFVSTVAVFENESVLENTSESVFQFLVRYGCIKRVKIKKNLDICYMV